ncbi:uncharacterized protein [Nicotiana tomentosiformis]|uniref:uncharacterized protein n=1 Tax=Nicotiana tomentosiformis TaxID=4098 RepID=UPI00388CADE9
MCDERVNRYLVDGRSSVNILLIRTVKVLGIPMNELSESRVIIQGFNQGGQRAIGTIRLGITIVVMQSSAWLHVIDAKTSYNVLLGRPWIEKNNVVPSTYHQCLKYYEGEVEKKIVVDDEPFTEAESHFADAKFYLKNRIVKELKANDGMKSKNDEPTTKRSEVIAGRAEAVIEEIQPNANKSYRGDIASYGKKAVKLSSKPLAGFVAENHLQNVALPAKRTDEGFDPNAYKLFAKAGYNPNEPSKLGKLPSEVATRMKRQTKVMVSCDEVLKVKPYIVVYTKERDAVEESVGSSYHVNAQSKHCVLSLMEDDEKLDDVSPCYHISFNDGDPQEDEDAKDAPPKLEEGVKATEFSDVFAWSYKEIPSLDPKVAVHHLAVKNGTRPVKQARRRFRPDLVPLIEIEVNKLIEAGFIWEVKYPMWVSSIVLVKKKNGQIRVCVDFRDLNNACPKDEFPLPIPELMIDATTGYEEMSFMDGSSGYNQIRMAPKDEELTAFCTPRELTDKLPDEDTMVVEVQPPWKMYFDAHRGGPGAGVVFFTSQGEVLPYSFTLMQLCSNNVVEYQALILGLEMAVKMKLL